MPVPSPQGCDAHIGTRYVSDHATDQPGWMSSVATENARHAYSTVTEAGCTAAAVEPLERPLSSKLTSLKVIGEVPALSALNSRTTTVPAAATTPPFLMSMFTITLPELVSSAFNVAGALACCTKEPGDDDTKSSTSRS